MWGTTQQSGQPHPGGEEERGWEWGVGGGDGGGGGGGGLRAREKLTMF